MSATPAELEDVITQIDMPLKDISRLTGMSAALLSRMRHGKVEITDRTMLHLATLARLSKGHITHIDKLARQLAGERMP
jgi:DNA-binding Xre family transcriptional regulator